MLWFFFVKKFVINKKNHYLCIKYKKMKIIEIRYWNFVYGDLEYEHEQEFDYSISKQHELIDHIMSMGYNVMLRQSQNYLTIWIDKGRFRQT